MVTKDDFVAASVHHQVGDLRDVQLAMNHDTVAHARAVSSGMLLQWDHKAAAPDPFNGWQDQGGSLRKSGTKVNRAKVSGALYSILEKQPGYSFFIDMADHRARSLVTPSGQAAPVFCFNRKKTNGQGRILWPLAGYQDHGSDEFLGGPNLRGVPWSEKQPVVAWRGSAGGWARLGKHGQGRMIRMHALLKRYQRQELSKVEAERALLTVDRHKLLAACQDDNRFDLGYTHFGPFDMDQMPLIGDFKRDRIARHDFGRFKYLAVLPGADVGSNFYWVMNSNSLGLVMTPEFDSFASVHFKPWEHYVPFRRDLRDLEQNLAWCEDHPDECQAMVQRANEMCAFLADGDLREEILGRVVHGVGAQLAM